MKQHGLASSSSSCASAGATSAVLAPPPLHGDATNRHKDHNVIRLITAMAEREAAVMEKSSAVAEKKTALAERDSALLQRDLAIADRDSALADRDRAMDALDLIRAEQEVCPQCHWNRQYAYGGGGGGGPKYAVMVGVPENVQPLAAAAGKMEGIVPGGDALPEKKRRKRSKKPKLTVDGKTVTPQKAKNRSNLSPPTKPAIKALHRTLFAKSPVAEGKTQKTKIAKQTDANEVSGFPFLDCSKVSSPYCSCTGMNEQCYRWGNGGWQSACCTNTISMYPLPMNPKKKSSRVAGRKMSAGAFARLMQRLVSEGWDVNTPVDLREYWAKHGTNMYVTIK